jgi:hypothetical protein
METAADSRRRRGRSDPGERCERDRGGSWKRDRDRGASWEL